MFTSDYRQYAEDNYKQKKLKTAPVILDSKEYLIFLYSITL